MGNRLAFCLLILLLAGYPLCTSAQPVDPHRLYEERCGGCHAQHAGDFVHDSLVPSDGNLKGRTSGRDLRRFLEAGHGGLSMDEIEILVAHLSSIHQSGQLFLDKCRICHDRALVLARRELVLDQDRLIGRYSGRDIERFLEGHGRLTADQVSTIVNALERHLLFADHGQVADAER